MKATKIRSLGGILQGRCRMCDHDLEVRIEGDRAFHYCTRDTCKFSHERHPMGSNVSYQGQRVSFAGEDAA